MCWQKKVLIQSEKIGVKKALHDDALFHNSIAEGEDEDLGQPRCVRRTVSRIRRAPPPYIGARTTSAPSMVIGMFPSRNSAISGARTNIVIGGRQRFIGVIFTASHAFHLECMVMS